MLGYINKFEDILKISSKIHRVGILVLGGAKWGWYAWYQIAWCRYNAIFLNIPIYFIWVKFKEDVPAHTDL